MNRRSFLRAAAAAAVAFGLRNVGVAGFAVATPKVLPKRIKTTGTTLQIKREGSELWEDLEGIVKVVKPDRLFDIPIHYAKPKETIFTDWMKCTRYEDITLILTVPDIDIRSDEAEKLRNGKWLIDGEWEESEGA